MRKRLREQWRLFLTGYWTGRGYNEMMWCPLTWWQRAITRILYPHEWRLPEPRLVDYAIDVLGVTEADIRDVRWLVDRDAVVLRLWNHRRFEISGLEAVRYRRA